MSRSCARFHSGTKTSSHDNHMLSQDMSHRGEGNVVLAISQFSHNLSVSLNNTTAAKNLKLTQVEHACSRQDPVGLVGGAGKIIFADFTGVTSECLRQAKHNSLKHAEKREAKVIMNWRMDLSPV